VQDIATAHFAVNCTTQPSSSAPSLDEPSNSVATPGRSCPPAQVSTFNGICAGAHGRGLLGEKEIHIVRRRKRRSTEDARMAAAEKHGDE